MKIPSLTFDNRFVNALPADNDDEKSNGQRQRQVHNAAFSWVMPTQVCQPKIIAFTDELAQLLDLEIENYDHNILSQVLSGNTLLDGMQPYAMNYGGHQFSHWAGQLGDGRAINLGEVLTQTNAHLTLQLKGAGLTPYSRTADGLAVLRSSIREFLCSEAMFHLGIPTTRALSLSLTGEDVVRDMFYDGHARAEQGAVVCRVSKSFMRFGSFQLPASRGDITLLKQMVDHCIAADFSHLLADDNQEQDKIIDKSHYLAWFEEVCSLTCKMVVHWIRVGFVHGVMNTDNMSIIGETIDYGPYGWVDNFDPNWTPNTTDVQNKRYRFGAQAEIAQWNLFQLANALYPLIEEAKPLEHLLNNFSELYQKLWHEMMINKLGLSLNHDSYEADQKLFIELEQILASIETDMTLFYRQLAKCPLDDGILTSDQWLEIFVDCYYQENQLITEYKVVFTAWLAQYIKRCKSDALSNEQRIELMNKTNPKYVLRNYLAQQAIEKAEQGNYSELHLLQKMLKNPYQEQVEFEAYAQKRPDWAKNKAGCGMLSCSS